MAGRAPKQTPCSLPVDVAVDGPLSRLYGMVNGRLRLGTFANEKDGEFMMNAILEY